MDISNFKRTFIISEVMFTILCSSIGAIVLTLCLPGAYFSGYPIIPVFFLAYGIFSIYMFELSQRRAPKKMLLFYLALKVMKILLSLILLFIYCVLVREEAKEFLLTFASFYIVYLIFETVFFASFEKNKKKKNINENETVA